MPRPPPVTIATRPSSIIGDRTSREQVEHRARVGAPELVLRALVEMADPELGRAVDVAGHDAFEELLVGALALLGALAFGRLATPARDVGLVVQLGDVVEHL